MPPPSSTAMTMMPLFPTLLNLSRTSTRTTTNATKTRPSRNMVAPMRAIRPLSVA